MKIRGESGAVPARGGGGMAGGTRPVAKAKSTAKANARALKAAKGPSLAKGKKKLEATLGSVERARAKQKAQDNMILGASKKQAYAKATKIMDKELSSSATNAAKVKVSAKSAKGLKKSDEKLMTEVIQKRSVRVVPPKNK